MWILIVSIIVTAFALAPISIIRESNTYGPLWATFTAIMVTFGGIGIAFFLGNIFRVKN
jgi:hypothetical protein